MIDFKELVKCGVHFGHQKSRWCPLMAPYIWGHKNRIHLINISKTAQQLEKASRFLKGVAEKGQTILWVGTKKPAQEVIKDTAKRVGMPSVSHRWIGGTLSNHAQVKKSITKLLHYEDVIGRASKADHYTKKELNMFQKLVDRLEKNIGGIRNLSYPIGAVVIVDVRKERSALKEAHRMGIPVVALVDTNSDPSMVDYVIPGNDDAPRAINLIVNYLGDSAEDGVKIAKKKKEEERERRKAEAAAKLAESKRKAVAAAAAAPKKAEKAPAKPHKVKVPVRSTTKDTKEKVVTVAPRDVRKEDVKKPAVKRTDIAKKTAPVKAEFIKKAAPVTKASEKTTKAAPVEKKTEEKKATKAVVKKTEAKKTALAKDEIKDKKDKTS